MRKLVIVNKNKYLNLEKKNRMEIWNRPEYGTVEVATVKIHSNFFFWPTNSQQFKLFLLKKNFWPKFKLV